MLTVGCGGAGRDGVTSYASAAATPADAQIAGAVQGCVSRIFSAIESESLSAESQEGFAIDVGWLVVGLRRLYVPGDSPKVTAAHIRESVSRFCAGVSDYLISTEFSDPGSEMTVVGNRDLLAHLHVAGLHDALDGEGIPIARTLRRETFDELAARVCAEIMNRGILDFSASLRNPAIDNQAFDRVLAEAVAEVSVTGQS